MVEGGNHMWVVHPSLKALKLLVNLFFKGSITIIESLHVLNVFVIVNGFIVETLQKTRKKQSGIDGITHDFNNSHKGTLAG
jgi:hypothetical protein